MSVGDEILQFAASIPRRMDTALDSAGAAVFGALVTITPVRTGVLRAGWVVRKPAPLVREIVDPVRYAPIIDAGRRPDERGILRGSVQAPEGMTAPVLRAVPAIVQISLEEAFE